jgi:branched-subunit amino acid transport protein
MTEAIPRGYFWLIVAIMCVGTFSIRGTLILFSSRLQIPARVKELFSFIPAAILPAFVTPAVFYHQGAVEWALGKERLLVLLLAGMICWFSQHFGHDRFGPGATVPCHRPLIGFDVATGPCLESY